MGAKDKKKNNEAKKAKKVRFERPFCAPLMYKKKSE